MKKTIFTKFHSLVWMKISSFSAPLVLMCLMALCVGSLHAQTVGCNLACNNSLNLALDENCTATITPDMVLEGEDADCPTDLSVVLQMPDGTPLSPANVVGPQHIGVTLTVVVSSDAGDNCWGYLTPEDKVAPEIECPAESDFWCFELDGILDGSINAGTPVASDACGNVELTYEDDLFDAGDCEDSQITRTWTATDESGNTATCEQIINIIVPSVTDVDFPDDLTLECGADTDPEDLPNADDYPAVDGYDIAFNACNLAATYEDQQVDICTNSYKVLRQWRVIDWCGNEVATETQIIKVLDTTAPVISCPDDFTVSTGYYSCDASLALPQPDLSDACNSATYTAASSAGTISGSNGNYSISDLPLGTHTITYTAEDECGNTSECSYEITVEDQVPPYAVCDEHTEVAVGSDGTARVYAETFDDGSYDNCSDVTFLVRRMDNGVPCAPPTQNAFAEYVEFCCSDVGNTLMVVLQVSDEAGNTNECMVEIVVEDKLGPAITCPPDITISCHYEYDLNDLAATFGTVVTNTADQEDVTTVDPDGLGTTTWGTDGLAYDNCDVTITENSNENIECGNGLITRVFTATDPNGLTASCVQRIRVQNFDPFNISDINWPQEEVERDCSQGIDADSVPGPTVDDDNCDNVFIGHEDLYLPIDDPFCYKIVRTWVVIDWCQYVPNSNNGVGRWEFNQVIKVTDNEAPVFTSCESPDTGCSYAEDCGPGYITLTAEAEDNCSGDNMTYYYEIDAFNDGNADIQGSGNDASGEYPIGVHSVTFYATDGCGNVAECSYTFEIVDCKLPTPVCQVIATSLMPSTGEITIWATDFEAGSSFDNCDDYEDLRFRIRKVGQFDAPNNTVPSANSTSVTFDCNEIGTQWVDLWVGDLNNNWDHCRTYIVIQDPNGVCGGSEMARIAGSVKNEMDEEIENVTIEIAGSNGFTPFVTGISGEFDFDDVPMHENYTVTPEKDVNPLNGISTYDLVIISKHILGVQPLTSPYKMIAADVNKSGSVTALDMVHLRKLILHIDSEFQNNTSWRFVDKNFVFANPTAPFASSFPEVISFNDLTADELEANFVAVKVGDVNDSAIPNSLVGIEGRTTAGNLVFDVADAQLKAGETYTIDFAAQSAVLGYQFTLAFDNTLEFVDASNTENFGLALLNEGVITTSWNNATATKAGFSLTFKALADVTLSDALTLNSKYTAAEAYNADADLLDVALAFNGQVATSDLALYQNTPNPFKGSTAIGFNLPEAASATLTIFDVSGKVLAQYEGDYAKGYNEVTVSDLAATGVLYYQLATANETITKKMITLK